MKTVTCTITTGLTSANIKLPIRYKPVWVTRRKKVFLGYVDEVFLTERNILNDWISYGPILENDLWEYAREDKA